MTTRTEGRNGPAVSAGAEYAAWAGRFRAALVEGRDDGEGEEKEDRTMTSIDDRAYWTARDAWLAADVEDEAAYAESSERIRHLIDRAENMPSEMRDGAKIEALRRRLAEAEAREEAEYRARFAATWTREETIARRVKWNEIAKTAPRMAGPNWVESKVGYTIDELKAAIALHNL